MPKSKSRLALKEVNLFADGIDDHQRDEAESLLESDPHHPDRVQMNRTMTIVPTLLGHKSKHFSDSGRATGPHFAIVPQI